MHPILQSESSECALASLTMIANAHGLQLDLFDLRRRFPVSLKGATLQQLISHAGALNFSSRPLRLEIDELAQLALPCILHWDLNHFVVLKKVGRGHITVLDPAVGERSLPFAEVSRHFTGVALELTPNAAFQPADQRQRVALSALTGKVRGLKRSLLQIFAVAVVLELFAIAAPLLNQLVVDDAIATHDTDLLSVLIIGFALRGERSALSAQLQTDLAQIERNRSSLDQEMSENAARQSTVVTAPFDGTVTALNLKLGQSVQSGQTLATLVPLNHATPGQQPTPLQAQLFAPSRTAGFVRPGQTVYLRYDAYPYQKFGLHTGHITSVSATPFAPSELPANLAPQLVAQAGSNEALYRINVQLDDQSIQAYGEALPLKAGLTLEADVLQERRKVWEWVLEPVLAARQQMKVLGAASKAVSAGS